MQKIKTSRVLALVLAIAMMIGLATTAFAVDTYALTVKDADSETIAEGAEVSVEKGTSAVVSVSAKKNAASDATDALNYTWTTADGTKVTVVPVSGTDGKQATIKGVAITTDPIVVTVDAKLNGVSVDTNTIKVAVVSYEADIALTGTTKLTTTAINPDGSTGYTPATTTANAIIDLQDATNTKISYGVLQAIYNLEKSVDVVTADDAMTFTINGVEMESFTKTSQYSGLVNFAYSEKEFSRTERAAIAAAAKEYGQTFATTINATEEKRDYYVIDLSKVVIPAQVGSVNVKIDLAVLYGTKTVTKLADAAYEGELYFYTYEDGVFTEGPSVTLTKRAENVLTFTMEEGAKYIVTTKKLEKKAAASSEAPVSSAASSAASSEKIPNTGDANVVAIAAVFAVVAMAGAAVVAKKATK